MGLSKISDSHDLLAWGGRWEEFELRVEASTGGGPDIFWTRALAIWLQSDQRCEGASVASPSQDQVDSWVEAEKNGQFFSFGSFWNPPFMAGWQDQTIVESEMWPGVVKNGMAELRDQLAVDVK